MLISSLVGVYAFVSLLDTVNAAATVPRDVPSLTVPLRRRAAVSKRTDPETLAAMAHNLRQKYNRPTRSLDRRQGSGAVAVTDENADSSYSGELSIGTPGAYPVVSLSTHWVLILHVRSNFRCHLRYGLQRPMGWVFVLHAGM
jgi:hypothetical protein